MILLMGLIQHLEQKNVYYTVDGSKSSHLKITISKGGGTSSWTDRGESWDDDVTLVVSDEETFLLQLITLTILLREHIL